jgi:hypothetical protein
MPAFPARLPCLQAIVKLQHFPASSQLPHSIADKVFTVLRIFSPLGANWKGMEKRPSQSRKAAHPCRQRLYSDPQNQNGPIHFCRIFA